MDMEYIDIRMYLVDALHVNSLKKNVYDNQNTPILRETVANGPRNKI